MTFDGTDPKAVAIAYHQERAARVQAEEGRDGYKAELEEWALVHGKLVATLRTPHERGLIGGSVAIDALEALEAWEASKR
jgi:hypothetical protein